MLTIKAEILKSGLRADDTYNVKVRITYKRQVKRISTNIYIHKSELTKSLKIKNGCKLKKRIDDLITYYQDIGNNLQVEREDYTIDDIIANLKGEEQKNKPIDFIKFSRDWIETATIKGADNYKYCINSFVRFLGKDNLNINDLTIKLLTQYAEYLCKNKEKKDKKLTSKSNSKTSNRAVSLYLGSIRHLFNEAKKKYNDYDRGIIIIPHSPFENFKVPRQEATRKRAITTQQIKAIWQLADLKEGKGVNKLCRFDLAKDCFMLSFFLMGMNSADLFTCSELKDNCIIYYRCKTKERRADNAKMVVKIPSLALPLIEKYKDITGKRFFKFYQWYSTADTFNAALNIGLKQVGKVLHLEDLEFYAARHSWATIAVNKAGVDKYAVHSALNHIDEKMKITDIYIERDFKMENDANEKVINSVF